MLEGKMTPDSYQKIKKYLFVKPLNKKEHSLEMEDAVHEDVGDRNGMVFEEKLLSEELYYYSRIEDKISVYMEKVKVNFTTVNLKEVH